MIDDLTVKIPKMEVSFNMRTYEDWMRQETLARKFGNKYTDKWVNFFVKNVDYIVNPTIKMKNKQIVSQFFDNYMPLLEDSFEISYTLFENMIVKIKRLYNDCYNYKLPSLNE